MRPVLSFVFLFSLILSVQGQTYSIIDGRAIKLFQEGEELTALKKYEDALVSYKSAIAREASFLEAYVKASQVLMTLGRLEEAEKIGLQGKAKLTGKNAKPNNLADFGWLFTNLYLKQGKFKEAYLQFQEVDSLFDEGFKKSLYYVQMREKMSFLHDQLGKTQDIQKEILLSPLNEFQLQYFPVLTADGEQILFTKRDGTGNFDKEDIYTAFLTNAGGWTKPQSIAQTINSTYNEGTCSITADGNILIYTSCDAPDSQGSCDLYVAYRINGAWQRPTNMGSKVNSRSWESQPSLSADGRVLFFSSNRKGGFGGNDIWYTVRQSDGNWSEAKNLGSIVNTQKDEISPFMFFNNEILFFASDGHQGFGGMDIFLSRVKNGVFNSPENLGLPINDHLDQVALFITAKKDYAYYTELNTSEGTKDRSLLYRFKFPQGIYIGENLTVTEGKVFNAKTGQPISATLSLVSLTNDSTLYQFQSDGKTGEFMMLYPDKPISGLYVEKQGYLPKIYNVERDKIKNVKDLKVELVPLSAGEEFVFENVFFDFNKYDLKQESLSSMKRLQKFLQENPNVNILISGHTDNVGSTSYNQTLSLQRAQSVQQFLVKGGLHPGRVLVEGKGDKEPMVPNTTSENQALNRRITIKIL
ncbi:MAG: OmpA family protein [Algoriphagus sp.]|jgi:outer membrane protein OmpA-like peptidoglycan-associated protein/Tol biopolymer transport system component|nr:OmpA family protein [Algoriphagus sp.]